MADPMTTDTAALVARLRERAEGRRYGVTSDLFNEAADRLESLSAPAPDGEVEAVARGWKQMRTALEDIARARVNSCCVSYVDPSVCDIASRAIPARAAIAALPPREPTDDGEAMRMAHSIMPGSGATFKTHEEIRAGVRRLDPFTRSRIDGLVADNSRLRKALRDCLEQAEGCFLNHYDTDPEDHAVPSHIAAARAALKGEA